MKYSNLLFYKDYVSISGEVFHIYHGCGCCLLAFRTGDSKPCCSGGGPGDPMYEFYADLDEIAMEASTIKSTSSFDVYPIGSLA